MKPSTLLNFLLVGLPVALATDVTLYQFAADPPSTTETVIREGYSIGATPISIQKDGQTIYVAEEVQTLAVYRNQRTTTTILATPTTNTYTFRADASRYHLEIATTIDGVTGTRDDDCTTQADGKMVCQVKLVAKNAQAATTIQLASTGTAIPWVTITNVENYHLATGASSASRNLPSSSGLPGLMACAVSIFGAVAGAMLL